MARLERLELPTNGFEGHYSIQLSYRRVGAHINKRERNPLRSFCQIRYLVLAGK